MKGTIEELLMILTAVMASVLLKGFVMTLIRDIIAEIHIALWF